MFDSRVITNVDTTLDSNIEKLSFQTKLLINLPEIQRLRHLYNSSVSYTSLFNHLSVTRYEHSVHSASQVSDLSIEFDTHKKIVLEAALLFHDVGHVPGSHSMDYVFSAMIHSPDIQKWGYGKNEYHEMHGPELIGRGLSSSTIKHILGDRAYGDVMAILTYDDKRTQAEKEETYGKFTPSLSPQEIHQLYQLKETLDRTSYLELDCVSMQYSDELTIDAIKKLKQYKASIRLTSDDITIMHNDLRDVDFFEQVLQIRKWHFQEIVGHPLNSLMTSILQRRIWENLGKRTWWNQEAEGNTLYETTKQLLFQKKYKLVFGEEGAKLLLSSKAQCPIDTVVPLITLDKSWLTEQGKSAIKPVSDFHLGLVTELCNAPVYDVSFAELRLMDYLKRCGVKATLYFTITGPIDKHFSYKVTSNKTTETKNHIPSLNNQQVIVSLDISKEHNISPEDLQKIVQDVFVSNQWISRTFPINRVYNPLVFCEPITRSKFSSSRLERMDSIRPKWLK